MTKIKKWILILCVMAIIITIILAIYKNTIKKNSGVDEKGDNYNFVPETSIQPVRIRNNYYVVKTCVTKFYLYYASIFDVEDGYEIIDDETKKSIEVQKQEGINAVYSILDKEYIKQKDITKENLEEKLPNINSVQINFIDIYVSEKDEIMSMYFVYGNLIDKKTKEISNFSLMVKIDAKEEIFSVFLQDYMQEKYNNINIGDNINIEIEKNIEKNYYNIYEYKHITDETYVTDLFNQYKMELLNNRKLAYSRLDEEYRIKKFETFENFEMYIKDNIKEIVAIQSNQYQKTKTDQYTQYVFADQGGKYYIFRETSPMKYTVILDTYTIDIPEFIEKYDNANEKEKAALNIQKFISALNDRDYEYAYNCLAEQFKVNNFSTQESFEQYIQEKMFTQNEFEFTQFNNEGEIYIFSLKLTDATGADEKEVVMQIIMQLGDDRSFAMSFNIS